MSYGAISFLPYSEIMSNARLHGINFDITKRGYKENRAMNINLYGRILFLPT